MRNARIVIFVAFLLLCLSSIAAQEQSRPNFTGVWKLDPHRSELTTAAPDAVTLYIHQNDPDFHLRSTETRRGKSSAWSVHGRTDGKTLQFKNREGTRITHMYWQGAQLVLEVKNDSKRGNQQQTVYRYSLADDGHTLIASEKSNDHEARWVFTKSG
jgi:DICT domain-containing protein